MVAIGWCKIAMLSGDNAKTASDDGYLEPEKKNHFFPTVPETRFHLPSLTDFICLFWLPAYIAPFSSFVDTQRNLMIEDL